jgi:hypothetical protein
MIRWATYLVLGVGAIATIGLMIWEAQWNTGLIEWLMVAGFAVWAGSPYVTLAVLNALSRSPASRLILLAGSLVIVGGGLPAYYDAFFVHLDAQSGLVFVFIPLYQWTATGLLTIVWAVFEWRARQSQIANR